MIFNDSLNSMVTNEPPEVSREKDFAKRNVVIELGEKGKQINKSKEALAVGSTQNVR